MKPDYDKAHALAIKRNDIVVIAAKMIYPEAFLDGWIDQDGNPPFLTAKLKYRQARALNVAAKILCLASKSKNLSEELSASEIQQWEDLGVPIKNNPAGIEIITNKYKTEGKDND